MDTSLFHVQRYTGDDNSDATVQGSSKSERHLLKKLKKEVALRRKARNVVKQRILQKEKKHSNADEKPTSSEVLNIAENNLPLTNSDDEKNNSQNQIKHKKIKAKSGASAVDDLNVTFTSAPSACITSFESSDEAPNDIASKQTHTKRKKKRLSSSDDKQDVSQNVKGNASKKRKRASETAQTEGEQDTTQVGYTGSLNANPKQPKYQKVANVTSPFEVAQVSNEGGLEGSKKKRAGKKKSKQLRKRLRNQGSAEVNGFTVLGKVDTQAPKKVKRVLPEWLTAPTVITADLQHCQVPVKQFAACLHPKLLQELKANNIVNFFPVQSTVVPWLLKSISQTCYRSNDICVSAPTGSGKTLAFVLPIVQALLERVVVTVRALIILPVRELAVQVYEVFHTYCKNVGLKVALVIGKSTFADEQKSLVRNSASGQQSLVDIVVATPGKLVDHIMKTPGFSLSQLKFLVIDEADRVMEEIKQNWLKFVEQSIVAGRSHHDYISIPGIPVVPSTNNGLIPSSITPASTQAWLAVPQKLLFSATLSQNPEKLQALRLFQPKLFTSVVTNSTLPKGTNKSADVNTGEFIGKYTTPAELEEFFVECDQAVKPLVLYHLLTEVSYRNVLCFTNSVDTSRRLYLLMKAMTQLAVRRVTARQIPAKRTKILKNFKQGKIDLIICTDALARGMDFDNVKFVISYDSPEHIKTYIHRIGRTARAGKTGTAVSFLDKKEVNRFQKFLTDAGKMSVKPIAISDDILETYEEKFRVALQEVAAIMKAT